MKNYLMLLLVVFCGYGLKAQVTEGFVDFDIITTDTVNNTTTHLPDTIKYTYSFQNKSFSTFSGTDSINNSLVVNSEGTYILKVAYSDKEYSFIPNSNNLDTLINYTDSSTVRYMITTEHQAIMGYYCTKAYMLSLSEETGDTLQVTTIWYTDQIKGYNFIAGAGTETLNLNGLILQYEYPIENGTVTVTPKSISTGSVNNSVFNPSLTGYVQIPDTE